MPRYHNISREEVATETEAFLEGTGGPYDWDDFCNLHLADPELESIRERCEKLPEWHPPTQPGYYCSSAGLVVLRNLVYYLRGGQYFLYQLGGRR